LFAEENCKFQEGQKSIQKPTDDVWMAARSSGKFWTRLDHGYITDWKTMLSRGFRSEWGFKPKLTSNLQATYKKQSIFWCVCEICYKMLSLIGDFVLKGRTVCYTKSGYSVNSFQSLLPGGNHKSAKGNSYILFKYV
jgi:hypothetical protein